jgi:integrase
MVKRTPSYSRHKASGQAVVCIDGHDYYLGKHGSPESHAEYNRLIAEWYANASHLPSAKPKDLSVAELLVKYWGWAEQHYTDADDGPSMELDNIKYALRPLRQLYGHTLAADFGPLALRAVREQLVTSGLSRGVVNSRTNRIRRVFKWAVSFELVPPSIYQAIQTVSGIRRGQGKVKEAPPVQPVREEHIESALPFMPGPVRAMVQVQRLADCRAGEVMRMRAIDICMTGPVWIYRPGRHKETNREKERVIFLGPQSQEVIQPFLTTNLEAYLFSPRAHVEAMHAERAARRRTKRPPSQLRRKRKLKPKRRPRECYDRRSYRLAVVRACTKAGVPSWCPLQLRHTAATQIRARYGVEAARVVLGHTKVETSQIYAERDLGRAQEIMAEIG